jgi:uncharacterized protein
VYAGCAMAAKTFILTYRYVPHMEEHRQPHRAAHLAYLEKARDKDFLVLAAAFADPVDGALLVVEADDPGAVLSWVAGDPYNQAGLIRATEVREVNVAVRR